MASRSECECVICLCLRVCVSGGEGAPGVSGALLATIPVSQVPRLPFPREKSPFWSSEKIEGRCFFVSPHQFPPLVFNPKEGPPERGLGRRAGARELN